jgi:hypothetical protein
LPARADPGLVDRRNGPIYRRNRNRSMNWTRFRRTLQRFPLARVRTVRSASAYLESTASPMKRCEQHVH